MMKYIGLNLLLILVFSSCMSNNNNKSASKEDTETIKTTSWDKSYGGVDKSYDTTLLKLREYISPQFKSLKYKDDETGRTMNYSLFVPKDYDQTKSYPLVLFMADGSTTGKGVKAPLMQGYGGIIWATEESQSKNPCFVLVPSYEGPDYVVNDEWETSVEVEMTLRLLDNVKKNYPIDSNRLYTTGQSMGGMMSFYFNANYPDIFAASIFVGSQWDINVLEPLAQMKFFYIVSAGDAKASGGMEALGNMLLDKNISIASTEFSATLSATEKEIKIQELLNKGSDINFVKFTKGTVTPEGVNGRGGEHMYSFDYAYQLNGVREWLFKQSKKE